MSGARGQECVWVRRGREIRIERIDSDRADLVLVTDAAGDDWFSVIIRSRHGPSAFSNAIYIDRSS